MHCSWICGFTFDSPDLDAVPSGLRGGDGGGGGEAFALYCVRAVHRTRPRAKCD